MKKIFLTLLLGILTYIVNAQEFVIKGILINQEKSPIGNASIVLTKNEVETPVVKAGTSDNNGCFEFSKIHSGEYILKIYYLGYAKKEINVQLKDSNINMGNIVLSEQTHDLSEVVVTANSVSSFAEKNTYRLTTIDRQSSSNALDALKSLPKLLVGMSDQIITTKGEQVKVLLNGINAAESDLLSIPPDNIARIEYYQTPPARYALLGIGAVVNVITKDNVIGGQVATSLQNALTTGFGNDLVNFKYNFGSSQIGIKYNLSYRDYSKRTADELLNYNFNGIEYYKNKIGYNNPYIYQNQVLELNFTNQKQDNYVFSTTISLNKFDQDKETGQNVEQMSPTNMLNSALNKENNKYLKPTIDLYYNKKIGKVQELSMNVVGTYYDATYTNKYLEKTATSDTNFYSATNINSYKYSLISDAIYSYSLEHEKISVGLRNMYGYSKQNVLTTGLENLTSNQNDLYGFAELTGNRSKLSYTLSAGLNFSSFDSYELDKNYSYLYFRPIINFRYELNDKSDIFLSYQINTRNPSLSELSKNPVMQDYYFAYCGNPNLEPFTTHSTMLSYGYMADNFNFSIDFSFDYSNNPILPYFITQPSYILQTYSNLEDAKKYSISLFTQWFPFKSKWLRLRFSSEMYRNENRGVDFSWSHNDYRLIPSAIVQYKKWGSTIFYQSSTKVLNGQLLRKSPSAAYVELTYKPVKNMTALLGIRYPFYSAWKSSSDTHSSALVSRHLSESIKDNANMIYLQFVYNFSFGKQSTNVKKNMSNTDKDSGILSQE